MRLTMWCQGYIQPLHGAFLGAFFEETSESPLKAKFAELPFYALG
jgi:hypothetical protein